MAPIHRKDIEDLIADLGREVAALQNARAQGPILAAYTSATLPAHPPTGLEVLVTDLGLRAWWNGTSWVYPPQQIAQQVVTAGPTGAITFSNIPQVFTDLQLIVAARTNGTGTDGYDTANMQFNGVTSNAYNWNTYYSKQSSGTVPATGLFSQPGMQCAEFWNNFFGSAGRGLLDAVVPNYSRTSGMKGMLSRSGASDAGTAGITQTYSGMSNITAPVTSLTIAMNAGAFTTGIFTLRGL
jgi:hypothetical protein